MAPQNLMPGVGRLIVATPELDDPNFRTTVVLLLEHDADGSLGVVLNRPTEVALTDALASADDLGGPGLLGAAATAPQVVFVGGPVQPNAVVTLGWADGTDQPDDFQIVFDTVGVVKMDPSDSGVADRLRAVRLFAGYAGWSPGQLEDEIERGSWFVVPAQPEDVVTADPGALWAEVLRRQGGVFHNPTADPSLN